MDKKTFRSDFVCITYSCHSAANRAQFSIRAGETRGLEGRDAKRKIMHKASSMSRIASIKDGYLNLISTWLLQYLRSIPLFDNMIQSIHRSVLF